MSDLEMANETIQDMYDAIEAACGWTGNEIEVELSGDRDKPFWVSDSDRAVKSSFEGCVMAVESWAHEDSQLYDWQY